MIKAAPRRRKADVVDENEHVATRYARAIVAGKYPAGKYHRKACERHLRDIKRQGSKSFPYVFDQTKADRFFSFAQKLKHYKGKWAGQRIKLEDHQKFRLGSIFGWVHKDTGLRRFRVAYNELARKNGKSLEAACVMLYVVFFDNESGAEGYCLHPSTRVLMRDLSWRQLQDVAVGDEVISVDEQIEGFRKHRKLRSAIVIGKKHTRRQSVRVTFTDGGSVVCSLDHKWLSQSGGANGFKWRETADLKPSYRISYLGRPWELQQTRDAGYIAGLFDGEGYLFHGERCAFQIGFCQKAGAVLDDCLSTLRRLGFSPTEPYDHAGGTKQFVVRGLYESLRLLGEIKPVRLWAKAPLLWENKKFPSSTREIASIEPNQVEELIDIETTSRTFIADGLVSHNCIATKREQSMLVFNDAAQLVRSSGLKSRIKILKRNMNRLERSMKLEALGADHDSTDGLNPSAVCVDEMHAYKNRGLIDVMITAWGARSQPLCFEITTAGDDPVSPCGDEHEYATKVLEQVFDDDRFFAFIAHADLDDDPFDPATFAKANPNYGISIDPEGMLADATKAKNNPNEAASFKQKRLNLWVSASAPWLSLEGWRKGQSDEWALDYANTGEYPAHLLGRKCFAGVDLASKLDLLPLVLVFPPVDEETKWSVLRWVWTPEGTLKDRALRDRAPYLLWNERGYLLTSPGTNVNHRHVQEKLVELRDHFDIQGIGFDPWHAGTIINDLITVEGFTEEQIVEVPQTYAGMSSAASKYEAEVLAGNMDAGGCPLMLWTNSNAVVQRDGKDNIYPVKKKSRGRIDPAMATIIGVALALKMSDSASIYETREMTVLGG